MSDLPGNFPGDLPDNEALEAMFAAESAPDPQARPWDGRARHLTFLHGLGGSPLTWENQVAKLPPVGVRAQAPWLRGMRPAANENFDFSAAAGDLLMNLQLEGAPRTAVIGHTLGGMVGMQMAVDSPETISHLVLIGAQIRPPAAALKAQKMALKMTPRSRFEAMGVSKNRVASALDMIATFEAGDHLDAITAKTLLVAGERDRAGRAAAEHIASNIAQADVFIVPGASTEPMNENVEEFNTRLWDFLGVEPHTY
ncbi:Putative aminoacrylate hydrolase RutD [Dermatophilus congolensis]|uniref:Putative aminoacrylate hydrolase RutD n=1 Tax=Dermatophilus congolensis TaxID=1863 RepID=A0A239V763_9MICO|nr:alpha/beta hydrolase [Dermatophilus congolensis]SNV18030.1 Putative aminoacrylate hydrolase RutD [Dermatophilus congolensis]